MSYAIRNDGQGWRAVNGPEDVEQEETYSDMQPLPPEQAKAIRRTEIKVELTLIDAKSARPLREGDTARIAALEAQAALLRSELAAL